jgi:hypothetical protein
VPSERPPDPLYFAFEQVEWRRNMQTMERYRVLPEDVGPAHALDVRNTQQRDPWRKYGSGPQLGGRRDPVFYDGIGPRAACGQRVLAVIPVDFTAEDPDACPECVELEQAGQARGRYTPFGSTRSYDGCSDAIRVANSAGDFIVYTCTLNDPAHRVPHKSFNGATWHDEEDFTPPPDGFV